VQASLRKFALELLQEGDEIATREAAVVQAALRPELDDFALVIVWQSPAATSTAASRRRKTQVQTACLDSDHDTYVLTVRSASIYLLIDPASDAVRILPGFITYPDRDHRCPLRTVFCSLMGVVAQGVSPGSEAWQGRNICDLARAANLLRGKRGDGVELRQAVLTNALKVADDGEETILHAQELRFPLLPHPREGGFLLF
jgi:hypothetical protein